MAKKKQIVIDVSKFKLTDSQLAGLQMGIHKTVARAMQDAKVGNVAPITKTRTAGAKTKFESVGAAVPLGMNANLAVTFTNTEPGASTLTASLGTQKQTIDRTTKITLNNVQTGDTIRIKGNSLGNTTVTIDISADPAQFIFPPGKINGSFFING
jgi:flagellar hook-length control protein FliK